MPDLGSPRPPDEHDHGHSHSLVDPTILRSRRGLRAVALALAILGAPAAAQLAIYLASISGALLADLIHDFAGERAAPTSPLLNG